ncbi:MAG TPA: hypothetical protein VGN34_01005 [Ktedonobacteraceae bacterium]|jgi:hypothetical protein
MTSHSTEPVLACNIAAIPKELRPVHQANTERVFASAQEVRELATGYAWRLPNETEMLQTVAAFLLYERLCCPFFHFTLEIEPNEGPIWLQITGASDVKSLLQSEGWVPPAS